MVALILVASVICVLSECVETQPGHNSVFAGPCRYLTAKPLRSRHGRRRRHGHSEVRRPIEHVVAKGLCSFNERRVSRRCPVARVLNSRGGCHLATHWRRRECGQHAPRCRRARCTQGLRWEGQHAFTKRHADRNSVPAAKLAAKALSIGVAKLRTTFGALGLLASHAVIANGGGVANDIHGSCLCASPKQESGSRDLIEG